MQNKRQEAVPHASLLRNSLSLTLLFPLQDTAKFSRDCLWVDLPANQIGPSPPVSPCSRRFGLWRPAVLATAISVSGRSSSPETGPQIDAGRTIGSCSSELVYSHLLSNATDARVVRQDKRAADRQS
ncbi:hypothetical protein PoMZ_04473, partial [Pyricularia oryzae]